MRVYRRREERIGGGDIEASKLSGGKKKIVVTGCLAQRYGEDLQKELPEVDLIVGFENYGMLPSLVEESLRERDDESRIVSPFDPASQKRSGSASGTMSKNIITNDDLVLPKKKTLVGEIRRLFGRRLIECGLRQNTRRIYA